MAVMTIILFVLLTDEATLEVNCSVCNVTFSSVVNFMLMTLFQLYTGGAVAQSVESATPGEEVLGSIPAAAARSLLVGSVTV